MTACHAFTNGKNYEIISDCGGSNGGSLEGYFCELKYDVHDKKRKIKKGKEGKRERGKEGKREKKDGRRESINNRKKKKNNEEKKTTKRRKR